MLDLYLAYKSSGISNERGDRERGGEMPTPFSSFSNSRFKEKNTILRVEDTYKERKAN